MTPESLSTLILAIVGIVLQLLFKYVPALQIWFNGLANKGLTMLLFCVITGAAYFGLSCTPFAAQLGIQIACTMDNIFLLFKAIFIIANAQQLAYLFTRKSARG